MIKVQDQTFFLNTDATSYWFRLTKFGHLEHVYFGPRLQVQPVEPLALKRVAELGATVLYDQSDRNYCLDVLPLEWSGQGYGDYRFSPSEISMPDGVFAADFTYVSHEVTRGCQPAVTLPTAYDEAKRPTTETLRVQLVDSASGVELDLYYTVFEASNVISRRAVLRNPAPRRPISDRPERDLVLRRLLSGTLDLPNRDFNLVTLDGAWIKEAHRHDRPVQYGITVNSSVTGASSNRHNPGFLLAERTATQDTGWVYGLNLIYSGNHFGFAELSSHDLVRVGIGVNSERFEWKLAPGEQFETPEMVLTMSPNGFNGASHNFHHFINNHVVRGPWKNRVRPVLLNNWEAHFFKFNESKLLDLARSAQELGVELFVLDDGWFGKRDSDQAGLGDYHVNRKKLPHGLAGFAKKVRGLGLEFGLWFEPEMVNEDSDLFRNHPDWAVRAPGRRNTQGRNQYVLDLANPVVQDYLIESVGSVLDSAPISYVKWDMNRHLSDAYSPTLSDRQQGEFSHTYVIGLYRVLREIFTKRPHILLESCSSGGNRFDLGMLCFSPQIWTSDDTDPVERLKIQGGLSYLYPPSTMGAHVSAAPHQQTLRDTQLSTRFNVAAFGVLGYELDLKFVRRLERKEIKDQIAFYKRHRETFQFGEFSRVDTAKANKVFWQVVSPDQSEAISGLFQTLAQASEGFDRLRVVGLDPSRRYQIQTRPQAIYLERFGELVKHLLPVALDPDGAILRTAGRLYHLTDAVECYQGDGALLDVGVLLNNQFVGSHYNEYTRLLGDFGSSLYVTSAIS